MASSSTPICVREGRLAVGGGFWRWASRGLERLFSPCFPKRSRWRSGAAQTRQRISARGFNGSRSAQLLRLNLGNLCERAAIEQRIGGRHQHVRARLVNRNMPEQIHAHTRADGLTHGDGPLKGDWAADARIDRI